MTHDQLPHRTNKKNSQRKKQLSILIMVFWGVLLSLNTWAHSFEELIDFKAISFQWISTPNFLSFFKFNDITTFHEDFFVVKLGHFIGFAILDFLIFNVWRNHKAAASISIIFAFLTEFLQLFFGRDGRLYDVIIDTLGVVSVYLLLKLNNTQRDK
ncbi:MAG TPA: VanZ family protein [Neobacillus sp.]